ncbi:unknown [Choristoneura fumiferana DEF multiple nucleopolyhedrovirus]|uniref:Uncharacterized protein n=1 Tax=Choristoneura fumiferana defective polyhedrosis virus TaxID=74660 RepID=Q6VTR0_NPVCD|nr:hypothetical protein CFDNVgORF79 [Choristoneura fumiferana DEF multiple nucleopolyhedrovirus]AAQ91778.1 unknown [Choristoneura fumiferana DEF multiple nucleopolyhedrovirus]
MVLIYFNVLYSFNGTRHTIGTRIGWGGNEQDPNLYY